MNERLYAVKNLLPDIGQVLIPLVAIIVLGILAGRARPADRLTMVPFPDAVETVTDPRPAVLPERVTIVESSPPPWPPFVRTSNVIRNRSTCPGGVCPVPPRVTNKEK